MTTTEILICFAFGVFLGWLFTASIYKATRHSFTKYPLWNIGDTVWTAVGNEKIQVTIKKYLLYYDWMDKSEHVIYTVENSSGYKWKLDEVYLWVSPS